MFTSETVLVLSREEIFVGKSRDSRTFAAGQRTRLAGKKFLGRCPCQASVWGLLMKTSI